MAIRGGAARYLTGQRAYMNDYPAPVNALSEPIEVGDWVRRNTTSGRIERVFGTADPTNLLGIAKSHNTTAPRMEPVDATRILVEHFTDDVAIWMGGTSAPTEANRNISYGIKQNIAAAAAVAGTNTGNGTVGSISTARDSRAETITLTALTATTWTVTGSKSGSIGTATSGVAFTSNFINFTHTAGATPHVAGDTFTIAITGDGSMIVDLTDTVNTRVRVVDYDVTRAAFFCIVLAAHRQSLVGT